MRACKKAVNPQFFIFHPSLISLGQYYPKTPPGLCWTDAAPSSAIQNRGYWDPHRQQPRCFQEEETLPNPRAFPQLPQQTRWLRGGPRGAVCSCVSPPCAPCQSATGRSPPASSTRTDAHGILLMAPYFLKQEPGVGREKKNRITRIHFN